MKTARILITICLLFTAATLFAQKEKPGIEGVWISDVSIRDYQTGDVIRTVRKIGRAHV